ncbi:hypothetical protein NDK50_34970 [Paraburkholderia bryophila]|uniref:beta-ketoacyl synthase N-terminal-like domain-containing protein n=1 Tax=Paraburkholderia bryophila TaxID=420952 RepID=UPI00234AD134|nr:beta-ketoacyl synthase N-terminal-like domain-containing protein [Paraburkholderia bryophila]WCM23155.1 hypothetical protein NDK50_34970 [Paraburkholderia bryophila]
MAYPSFETDNAGYVGVLPDMPVWERAPVMFDRAFGNVIPEAVFACDLIVGASSLGDLTGPYAGRPADALFAELETRCKRRQLPRFFLVSSACSSGTDAMIAAAQLVESGRVDTVAVIAFDTLEPGKLLQHIALGTQGADRASPFDAARAGTSFGEGVACVIVGNANGLANIGLQGVASVCGYGSSSDAQDIAAPDATGAYARAAMTAALSGSNRVPEYVNAHGSATRLNDEAEYNAMKSAFGPLFSKVNVGSTKGALGHTLGATGLVEATVTITALVTGHYPPSIGFADGSDFPDLNVLKVQKQSANERRTAMSLTFGFGGVNSAVHFSLDR